MAVHIGNSWDERLKDQWEKPYYQKLRQRLIFEYKQYEIYPPMGEIFRALELVDYNDVKVVLLGQDPYHGPHQAEGLSFSVKKGVKIPPSLVNIFKECEEDVGATPPGHGSLVQWAKEGVLLLNTALTVRQGEANSHEDIGWQLLTDHIISLLNDRKKPMVFILWGRNAQLKQRLITNRDHLILKAPHPSPLSAYRGFFGSKPFSKANAFLEGKGMSPIDWQLQ